MTYPTRFPSGLGPRSDRAASATVSRFLAPLQDLFQLGFAVAIGVLMDTFITRTLIVPALISQFGRWNWWPSSTA